MKLSLRLTNLARHILVTLGVGMVFAVSLRAEEKPAAGTWSLKPTILDSGDGEYWAGALRWEGKVNQYYSSWEGSMSAFAAGNTKGTVATDAWAHSENMLATIAAGLSWQSGSPKQLVISPGADNGNAPRANLNPGNDSPECRFEVSVKAGFESDQPMDNYALTYGPQIGFYHNNMDIMWPLVPTFTVDYQQEVIVRSSYYRSLGLEDDGSSSRFSADVSWDLPVGNWMPGNNPYVKNIGAIVNLHYNLAYGTPSVIEQKGQDTSSYYEIGFNYLFTNPRKFWLQSLYLTVAHGHLPQTQDNTTMVFVGLNFGNKKSVQK